MLDEASAGRIIVLVLGLAAFGASLAASIVYRHWLLEYIDPDPDLRRKEMHLSWFSANLSIGELLDQSVLRGGETPAWAEKTRNNSEPPSGAA